MSYSITLTNNTTIGTIADGSYDNSATSLTLVGRNYSNYGQIMTNNLVHLLENFASTSAPGNPLNGQIWWNTTLNALQIYYKSADGLTTGWKNVGRATSSSSAPTLAFSGDFWWDSANQQLYAYNGSAWILIGPAYKSGLGKSGAIWEQIVDTNTVSHDVVSIYLDGVRTLIISQDSEFTPSVAITGFSTIKPGFNANIVTGSTLWGTANNSSYLGGLSSANFLQTSGTNTASGQLIINNDNGITVGASSNASLKISSTNLNIVNNTNTGIIYLSTGATAQLTINGATGTVQVASDPTTGLGVATKQYVDNSFINSPALGGTPTTPTAGPGTNTTQVASTAFVYQSNVGLKSYTDTNLALKSNLASPTFTGDPQAPTPAVGDNDTSIATTAFVYQANLAMTGYVAGTYATIASPTFTGTPAAPTASAGTNTTQLATTAFVTSAINSVNGTIANLALNQISQGNSSLTILDSGIGNITLSIDGATILTGSTAGVVLSAGAIAATVGQTYNDVGNTAIATTSYVKSASTWWGNSSSRSAKFVSTNAPDNSQGNNGDFWFQLSS
jgi:hypothetical protein